MPASKSSIAVIGLGYVGLPLAIQLAKHLQVVGFDINEKRISELQSGFDRTNEIDKKTLSESPLHITSQTQDIKGKDIYIVTVPTPITQDNLPDLTSLQKASEAVGKVISKGAIVVFESTVYPGVTEDICGPIIEKYSNLRCGKDFYLGYSPERINPGDKHHTIDRITKIVAGQTLEVTQRLGKVYGLINNGNVFLAKNIKTAEAAKVIENAQRDINIAFINEITAIFSKLNLSIYDVLEAAGTKWNFLKFSPGLVGGHCIGVDPYYLAHISKELGHEPEIILAGRKTNEYMSRFITDSIHEVLISDLHQNQARILILGITFKENVPDIRNTKIIDLIEALKKKGHHVDVHDPLADPQETKEELNINLLPTLEHLKAYDCVIGTVPHEAYTRFTLETFKTLLKDKGLVADVKNIWKNIPFNNQFRYWSL
jgi:UDP-N-acetyl-D-galactosamine dehydrogenase